MEEALLALSAAQVERIRVAFASLTEGLLTSTEFVAMVVNLVLTGNVRGYALGAATARGVIERGVAVPQVTPDVLNPAHLDEDRITRALETILEAEQDTQMQLERLADNEPAQAASDGSHDVIRSSPHVVGWTRAINVDACELCVWLKKEHLRSGGYIYPPERPIHKHVGCLCEMNPITKEQK